MTDVRDKVEQTMSDNAPGPFVKYPNFELLLESVPGALGDLGRMFVADKDLNARTRIRAQVASLFDLLAADTTYPDIPGLDPKEAARRPVPGQAGVGVAPFVRPAAEPIFDVAGVADGPEWPAAIPPAAPQAPRQATDVLPIPGAEPAEAGQP